MLRQPHQAFVLPAFDVNEAAPRRAARPALSRASEPRAAAAPGGRGGASKRRAAAGGGGRKNKKKGDKRRSEAAQGTGRRLAEEAAAEEAAHPGRGGDGGRGGSGGSDGAWLRVRAKGHLRSLVESGRAVPFAFHQYQLGHECDQASRWVCPHEPQTH